MNYRKLFLLILLFLPLKPLSAFFGGGQSFSVDMVSAGDIFPSPSLLNAGFMESKDRNYLPMFEYVKDTLSAAEYATCWFGGPVEGTNKVYSGYPSYNNPPEYPLAARDAGFDIFLHTNHLFDHGVKGFFSTIKFFRAAGVKLLGMHDTEEDSRKITILETNGIKIAMMSYLFGSNVWLKHKPWMADYVNKKKILSDVLRSKKLGADFTIVALHWGTEYQRAPDKPQTVLAREIAAAGADMILGSHPHVIQPADMIVTTNAGGLVRKTFIIYSFGNFLSTMRGRYTDCGIMMRYRIEKDAAKKQTVLKKISYIPVWVLYRYEPDKKNYRIRLLPSKKTMEEYRRNGGKNMITEAEYQKMKLSYDDTIALLDNPGIGFVHEE